ncbi:ATP synthase subunit K, mitochondrial [Diutina catenulata]
MGAAYHIMGRAVPPHQLALATLGLVTFIAMPKPWGPAAPKHPEINASSKEEEAFIKKFLQDNLKAEEKH